MELPLTTVVLLRLLHPRHRTRELPTRTPDWPKLERRIRHERPLVRWIKALWHDSMLPSSVSRLFNKLWPRTTLWPTELLPRRQLCLPTVLLVPVLR